MISSLRHRKRAIATYLQTFVLIAVALAGSLIAYRTVAAYAGTAGAPAVQVWDASIRQDFGVALERLTVSNSGQTTFSSFEVLNPGFASGLSYCYAVTSVSGAVVVQTCPRMSLDPSAIRIASNLTSGNTVVVVLVLAGAGAVSPGRSYSFFVIAPGAAVAGGRVVAETG